MKLNWNKVKIPELSQFGTKPIYLVLIKKGRILILSILQENANLPDFLGLLRDNKVPVESRTNLRLIRNKIYLNK